MKKDFRESGKGKIKPKAVADATYGKILAIAEITGTPDRVFTALTSSEVEQWWKFPGVYHQKDWKADLSVGGKWSVTVETNDGQQIRAWGEFAEIDFPKKLVMTRRFDLHPFLGERETTINYTFEPSPHGTLVTVRDEGFIGKTEAAFGNAEIWEKVLSWLDNYQNQK